MDAVASLPAGVAAGLAGDRTPAVVALVLGRGGGGKRISFGWRGVAAWLLDTVVAVLVVALDTGRVAIGAVVRTL